MVIMKCIYCEREARSRNVHPLQYLAQSLQGPREFVSFHLRRASGLPAERTENASLYACSNALTRVRSAVKLSSSYRRSSNSDSLYSDATRRFCTDSREKLTRRSAQIGSAGCEWGSGTNTHA